MSEDETTPFGMTPAAAKKLRAPFPAKLVGKLPKPTKAENPKGRCDECGGYHGLPAVHLDYVGHAAVTDRLLEVDPGWSWEPMVLDEDGLPRLDRKGNLWIRLTILGVTRIGVGDGKSAKEIIGDAIRNAAMRFGVALDLWSKEDLHAPSEAEPAPTPPPPADPKPQGQQTAEAKAPATPTRSWEETIATLKAADGTIVWEGLIAHIVSAFYTLPMEPDQKADLRVRMSALVDTVQAEVALGDIPPPDIDAYVRAVATAFDGLAIDVQQFVSQAPPPGVTAEEEA